MQIQKININNLPSIFFNRIYEIDLLRAIAIIGVIANHLGILQGGFIGVDIFFVISGYVITLLLIKEHTDNKFSIIKFYYRRSTRIIPPLLAVSIFIFFISIFIFYENQDYDFIKKSFLYQAAFAQNLFFTTHTAEYFHGLSHAKLNLHTWSLAVEEQFYILYPLFFAIAFKKRSRNHFIAIFIFTFLVTFLYSMIFSAYIKKSTLISMQYYMLPSRIWELLIGALACLVTSSTYSTRIFKRISSINITSVCFTIILLSMFFTQPTMKWPNYLAILPVFSTAIALIFIHANRSDSIPKIMNNSILMVIGRSSYSLYLWHWPILGFLTYTNSDFGSSWYDFFAYFSLLGFITFLSYTFIEQKRHFITFKQSNVIFIIFIAFCLYAGTRNINYSGFPAEIKNILETGSYDKSECKSCVTQPTKPFIVLWGDSHAQMLLQTVESLASELGIQLVKINSNLNSDHSQLTRLYQNPLYIGMVLANRWSMYAIGFPSFEPEEVGNRYLHYNGIHPDDPSTGLQVFSKVLENFIQNFGNKPIIIIRQVPQFPFFPKKEAIMDYLGLKLRQHQKKPLELHRQDHSDVDALFNKISQLNPQVQLLDPALILCPEGECVWRNNSTIYYKDDDHLSIFGAQLLQPLLRKSLTSILETNKPE